MIMSDQTVNSHECKQNKNLKSYKNIKNLDEPRVSRLQKRTNKTYILSMVIHRNNENIDVVDC